MISNRDRHTCNLGGMRPRARAPPPDTAPPPRCVVLKLASLGMFSFSLGQTVLCIGQNKTSCASYGYNACDYQVAGGSSKARPSCPSPVSLLRESSTPPGGAVHSTRGAGCGVSLLTSHPGGPGSN